MQYFLSNRLVCSLYPNKWYGTYRTKTMWLTSHILTNRIRNNTKILYLTFFYLNYLNLKFRRKNSLKKTDKFYKYYVKHFKL